MTTIHDILSNNNHRPFALPASPWAYYQEWNKALFLHWKVPHNALRKLVPKELNLDTFENEAYISLVAFTMQNTRPRNLPALKFISDFDEINIRTYVNNNNKPGVYFLSIEAQKYLSVLIARNLSGLPYEKSKIHRTKSEYHSVHSKKGFHFNTKFQVGETLAQKTERDKWLTERYCAYLDYNNVIGRYDIHHKEWNIQDVTLQHLSLQYTLGDITLTTSPDFIHYSEGVKVLAWKRLSVNPSKVSGTTKIYSVLLDDKIIGTTYLEKADPPMGVAFGEIFFKNIPEPYNFIKGYCQSNKIPFSDDLKDKIIMTRDISGLRVIDSSEPEIEIKGLGCSISGASNYSFEITIEGIPYPFYEEEFPHHVNTYKKSNA